MAKVLQNKIPIALLSRTLYDNSHPYSHYRLIDNDYHFIISRGDESPAYQVSVRSPNPIEAYISLLDKGYTIHEAPQF
jgi:hypothetical protein